MQKLVSLLVGLFVTAIAFSQQLKIDVKSGDKYKVQTTVKTTNSTEVMGQSMESTSDSKSNMTYEIGSITKEEINLLATLTKMNISSAAMGQEMNFDSEKDDNSGPLADALSKKMNKPKNITINQKGVITRQDKEEDDGEDATNIPGAVKNTVELFIPALIGRTLNAGDSFEHTDSSSEDGSSSVRTGTYTVKSIEKDKMMVSYTGTELMTGVMEQMGMQMNLSFTNKVSHEIEVDIKTGMVNESSSVIESSGTIDAAGMSIPSSGKTTLSLKIEKK